MTFIKKTQTIHMKYIFLVFTFFTFYNIQAQELTLDQLIEAKNMDSDDAIEFLENSNFEIQAVFENQMYFLCTSCIDKSQAAIKLIFEAEKDGPNILKVISMELALQQRENYNSLKTSFKESPIIKDITKMSATLEPQSETFTSAIEKSTYRANINEQKEFFSFARFIPAYPIYKERNIEFKFKYTITIQ